MRNKEWETITLELTETEKNPVPIVSTAAIATIGVADGRIVPLVIIDCSSRPDVELFIRAHQHTEPGDVETIWVKPSEKEGKINLILCFLRPSRCNVRLEFDILIHGGLVDSIVNSQSLYLQCGREGDRFISTMEKDRIMVEVPSKSFREEWDAILYRRLEKDFRARGLSKQQAKSRAYEVMRKWRALAGTRMREV